MYFHGTLTVDPSEMTEIVLCKPTNAFAKICFYLTAGLASQKEEQETFTAVSILQQLNRAFLSLGVNDIVRLAKDEIDLYRDTEGRKDDLRAAMDSLRERLGDTDHALFHTLTLVLEHEDQILKYLIRVDVSRVHRVGEYPISITVNGLLKELRSVYYTDDSDKTLPDVRDRLAGNFQSQETYEAYTADKQEHFDGFLGEIKRVLQEQMQTDNIRKHSDRRIVRPSKQMEEGDTWAYAHNQGEPIFDDDYGIDDYIFYTWIWSDLVHHRDLYCNNCSVVDQSGQVVIEVGETGFQAGETSTMDPNSPFELPSEGDIQIHGENAYAAEISAAGHAIPEAATVDSSGASSDGGWFNFSSDASGDDTAKASSEGGWFSFSDGGGSDWGGDSGDGGGGCGGGCGGCGGGD